MLSISGRIKKSTKQGLPTEARGMTPKGSSRGSVSSRVTKKDAIDRDIMAINSHRSIAKMSAQVLPMYISCGRDDFSMTSQTPSVCSSFMTKTVSGSEMEESQSSYKYQIPRSSKNERQSNHNDNKGAATPKPTKKSNLAMPAEYKPDRPQSSNMFKKPESQKLEVSGVDSTNRNPEFDSKPVVKPDVSNRIRNSEKVEQSFPGQFYADDNLKKLRNLFIKKEYLPEIDDKEFLRKEQTNGESVLEKNIEKILEQHDNDRGGGDHGPCYVPGQLLQKLPFPKEGTMKRDHKPISFKDAKPIFGDANVPKEAYRPKLPGEKDTTYRVFLINEG